MSANSTGFVLASALAGTCLSDFISGFAHWAADSYGKSTMPIFAGFVRTFREHHTDQLDITRHDAIETNGDVVVFSSAVHFLLLFVVLSPWFAARPNFQAEAALSSSEHNRTQSGNKPLKIHRYASSMIQSRLRWAPVLLLITFAALPIACKSEKSDDAAAADSAEPLASGAHKGKRELPPAAFEACQGKGVGDACTVTFGEKQIEAKCAAVPDGRLACRPEHGGHKKPE